MIAKLFLALKNFAWFRRLAWRPIYNYLARRFPNPDWYFMNFGYVPSEHEVLLELKGGNLEIQKYQLQLYYYLVVKTEIEGKRILEVGSGRGGGAKYISEYLCPESYIGMDIAVTAVDLANKLHHLPNLKFIQGNAEAIPLADSSIDVVINVESCHAYGSVELFLKEVNRVLKPGGYLLLTDVRYTNEMDILKSQLLSTGMDLIEEEDITLNVIKAIEAEDKTKRERIDILIPPKQQKLFAEFAGVIGSQMHINLKKRKRLYFRFVLKKQA